MLRKNEVGCSDAYVDYVVLLSISFLGMVGCSMADSFGVVIARSLFRYLWGFRSTVCDLFGGTPCTSIFSLVSVARQGNQNSFLSLSYPAWVCDGV